MRLIKSCAAPMTLLLVFIFGTTVAHAFNLSACWQVFTKTDPYLNAIIHRHGRDQSLGVRLTNEETQLLNRIKDRRVNVSEVFRFRSKDDAKFIQDAEANIAIKSLADAKHRQLLIDLAEVYLPYFGDTSFLIEAVNAYHKGYNLTDIETTLKLYSYVQDLSDPHPLTFNLRFISNTIHAAYSLPLDTIQMILHDSKRENEIDWNIFLQNIRFYLDDVNPNITGWKRPFQTFTDLQMKPLSKETPLYENLVHRVAANFALTANEAHIAIHAATHINPDSIKPVYLTYHEVALRICVFYPEICKRDTEQSTNDLINQISSTSTLIDRLVDLLSLEKPLHKSATKQLQWIFTRLSVNNISFKNFRAFGPLKKPEHFFNGFLNQHIGDASTLEPSEVADVLTTYLEILSLANESYADFDELMSQINLISDDESMVLLSIDDKLEILSKAIFILKAYDHTNAPVKALVNDLNSAHMLGDGGLNHNDLTQIILSFAEAQVTNSTTGSPIISAIKKYLYVDLEYPVPLPTTAGIKDL